MGPEPIGHAVAGWPESRSVSEFARREWCVEVRDVFVAPQRRRMGVATELMEAAEVAAAAYGVPKVGLMTGLDDDYAATRELYARLGYEDIGRGPFISSAALVDERDGRIVFLGVLTYLTKTLS